MTAYVFVSYSRRDERHITPIVQLLRAAIAGVPSASGKHWDFVFQDKDHLVPGGNWEDDIDRAIAESERMFVFWCKHSASSEQVKREYELAQKLEKIVVPVLLDRTALPASLSEIQGVDLRALETHGPAIGVTPRSPEAFDEVSATQLPTLNGSVVLEKFAGVLGVEPRIISSSILEFEELSRKATLEEHAELIKKFLSRKRNRLHKKPRPR